MIYPHKINESNQLAEQMAKYLKAGGKIHSVKTISDEMTDNARMRSQVRKAMLKILNHVSQQEFANFAAISRNAVGKIAIKYHVGDRTYVKVNQALERLDQQKDPEAIAFLNKMKSNA